MLLFPLFLTSACSIEVRPYQQNIFVEELRWVKPTSIAVAWWQNQATLYRSEPPFLIVDDRSIADIVVTSSSGAGMPDLVAWFDLETRNIVLTDDVYPKENVIIAHELGHSLGLEHTDIRLGRNVMTHIPTCDLPVQKNIDPDPFSRRSASLERIECGYCPNLTIEQALHSLDLHLEY